MKTLYLINLLYFVPGIQHTAAQQVRALSLALALTLALSLQHGSGHVDTASVRALEYLSIRHMWQAGHLCCFSFNGI